MAGDGSPRPMTEEEPLSEQKPKTPESAGEADPAPIEPGKSVEQAE